MIRILIALATAYAAVVGFAYFFQRSLLYFPDASPPSPGASGVSDMEEIVLATSDGLQLNALYGRAKGALPTIVLFHGNAGHLGHRGFKARVFLDHGYGVLLAAYRGYGGNPGRPNEHGLYADGAAALAYLRDVAHVPLERIVLYGESLGTGVAVELAAGQKFAAVILEAPFTSMTDLGAHHYPYLPVRWLMWDRFDSAGKIERVTGPVLMFRGGRDQVVPSKFGARLHAVAPEGKTLELLEDAGHNDLWENGAAHLVLSFLNNQMGAPVLQAP